MKNKIIKKTIVLILANIALFVLCYIFFRNTDKYFTVSIQANSFAIPIVYTIISLYFLIKKSKAKKLPFRETFKETFLPMWFAITISTACIGLFINYIDTNTSQILREQQITAQRTNLDTEYKSISTPTTDEVALYNKHSEMFNSKESKEMPFLGQRTIISFLGIFSLLFLFISLALAFFFKNKPL